MRYNDRPGLLLINLGTPRSPRPSDVRPYLREFLSDPRVIDVSALKRWLVLNLFILPFRPRKSGEAYEQIWTERGSPLLFHSQDLAAKVRKRIGDGVDVDLAMRYGEPSIAAALERFKHRGVRRIVAFPLYPQYSTAATGSSMEKVYAEAAKYWVTPYIQVVPPFYDHPSFLDACAEQARPVLEGACPERVYFSFHGVPERHVTKGDLTGSHCLCRDDCCDTISSVNADCYRAQCYATARLLAERLGISEDNRTVCFQSRLGRDPWLRPYTDHVVQEEPRRGVKNAVILSPAFVADCLETIEELGIRAVNDWKANGGENLTLVPAVNSSDRWADAVVEIAREASPWLTATSKVAVES